MDVIVEAVPEEVVMGLGRQGAEPDRGNCPEPDRKRSQH